MRASIEENLGPAGIVVANAGGVQAFRVGVQRFPEQVVDD
jgi:hypothetical protein